MLKITRNRTVLENEQNSYRLVILKIRTVMQKFETIQKWRQQWIKNRYDAQ